MPTETNDREDAKIGLLRERNVIIENSHFVYTSGKHGSVYVAKDEIFAHVRELNYFCSFIGDYFEESRIDVVVGPAIGGAIIANRVAEHLITHTRKKVLALFTEKTVDGEFSLSRGKYSEHVFGKNCLVVEDVLTTGGSAKKTIEAVRRCGGNVVGVGVFVNRGGITGEQLGVDNLFSLVNLSFESYDALDCPLCKENVLINSTYGHGSKFLEEKTRLEKKEE